MKIITKKQADGLWIAEVADVPARWAEGTTEAEAVSKLIYSLVDCYNIQVEVRFLS